MEKLSPDIHSDANINYEIIEGLLTPLYGNHFPVKTVHGNNYKHKKFSWITAGIINSITYILYRKLKQTPQIDMSYNNISVSLHVYKK